jgi:choline dehydrogenase-like flavoprotein
MPDIETDVLVIGSGFGGAALALRLASTGLRVHVVEKGGAVGPEGSPIADERFRQTQDPRYLTKYLKGLGGDHLSLTYAEALGGGSGFYEMASFRAPSLAFGQRDDQGRRLWPAGLDREALDPWYDLAERMLRVEQIGIDEVPKSGLVFSLLMKNLGYSCDRGRYAVQGCHGSGFCVTGCPWGAKQSLHVNYLAQAVERGAVISCGLDALEIEAIGGVERTRGIDLFDRLQPRYRVRCRRQSGDREAVCYLARLVVLGGGTVGTASLLLRSRKNLPRLSPHVGRNIAFNGSVKVAGLLADHFPDGDMYTGRSHPGMISFEFLASHGVAVSAAKALPITAIAGSHLRLDGDPRDPSWWGEANVDLMQKFRRRVLALVSFGLTPPAGRIELDDLGTPQLHLAPTAELSRYLTRTRELLESIFTRNGCRVIRVEPVRTDGTPHAGTHFSTAHQTGSARMADRVEDGVVDAAGEVFGYPGLYVSDGAAIPSSLAVNTSLTILANAERIADGIVSRYGLAA